MCARPFPTALFTSGSVCDSSVNHTGLRIYLRRNGESSALGRKMAARNDGCEDARQRVTKQQWKHVKGAEMKQMKTFIISNVHNMTNIQHTRVMIY